MMGKIIDIYFVCPGKIVGQHLNQTVNKGLEVRHQGVDKIFFKSHSANMNFKG